ncbi:glycosyltransferase [Pseudoalteromonas gelatinilytica]|uniref:glycosyltransferase n=1 Tax=Pseudoalteromonas gelatinilytica TaxID=1703256 RepID=UPI0015FF381D|nr:glycosyltransferase [Pseudoalteromonas profundi]
MNNVSILASIYKGEQPHYFEKCLESLVNQEYKASEVVLVEDGPLPKELLTIIESFRSRLNIITVKVLENKGLGNALNVGLEKCSQPLVARMDTDDIACESRLKVQVAFMADNPHISLCGSYSIEIDAEGKVGRLRTMPVHHDQIVSNLWTNPFIHPSVMFRKDAVLGVGGYDANLSRRQDYELWFRCAVNKLQFANIPKPLIYYRFTNETHKKQSKSVCLLQAKIGFKGSINAGLGVLKASLCYIPYIRSFLPQKLQHIVYNSLKRFDPRNVKE